MSVYDIYTHWTKQRDKNTEFYYRALVAQSLKSALCLRPAALARLLV